MAADDKTPTGRDLDKALELEEARLSERVRMRLDSHEDEDSTVIDARAAAQVKHDSSPPKDSIARQLVYVLNTMPPWSRPFVVVVLVLVFAGSGWSLASVAGWVGK